MRVARLRVLPGLRRPKLCGSALPEDLVVAGDEPATLRRFLVARKWDVDKAQEQLQRTLDWRAKEFGVAAFLARWHHAKVRAGPLAHSLLRPQAKPPLKRLALVRSLLPANPHLGFSKDGWPVTLLSLGASDPSAVARDLQGEDLVRCPAARHRPAFA